MHTGYYVGIFLAAILNYLIGSKFGWRWMVSLADCRPSAGVGAPRRHRAGVLAKEEKVAHTWRIWQPFAPYFPMHCAVARFLNTLYMLASICGLWPATVYVPRR